MVLSAHNEAEERLLLLFSINDHPPSEEPMAAVLTAGQTVHGGVIVYAIAVERHPFLWGLLSGDHTHLLD